MKKKVGFVLSGGGSHGFAQLGAVKALYEAGIFPDKIAGCSAGALLGAGLASGKDIADMENLMFSSYRSALIDPTWSAGGLIRGGKIVDLVVDFIGVQNFEDLGIPLVVNAVDINSGVERIFSTGLLKPALHASIAVPGVIASKRIDNDYYVDGGISNPVPIHLMENVDLAVVIDVSFIWRKIDSKSSAIQVMTQSLIMMQQQVVQSSLEEYRKKGKLIHIVPDAANFGLFELSKSSLRKMFDLGYEAGKKAVNEIHNLD